jgi:D-tyrosyl-tRNA(Tyr) deacylase
LIGLLQRITSAAVEVEGREIARIGPGLLVFVAVERDDSSVEAERLLERLLNYRVFADAEGRMNLSVMDVRGGLLLVPQFTLAADTKKGLRPGFSTAAPPEEGRRLFEELLGLARRRLPGVQAGHFGAHMQVSLVNDGPVTFWIQAPRHGA